MSLWHLSRAHAARFLLTLGVLTAAIAVEARAASHSLSVTNGSGGGTHEEGATVFVWANPYDGASPDRASRETPQPDLPNRTFDQWTGDVQYLDNPYAQDTRLVMPAADVSITATYKDTSKWAPKTVMSEFPQNHRAVIFLFHGKGGCAACEFNLAESRRFIDDALSRGYAVVAIDSIERGDEARWSHTEWSEPPDPANNVDMHRVVQVRDQLVSVGRMSISDPVYLVGMSNGGIFASQFTRETQLALGFPVAAMVLMVSPGSLAATPATDVPTIFILAENDSMPDGTGSVNTTALLHHDDLLARGVPTQLHIAREIPLHPDRFWQIEGLNQTDSHAIFDSFSRNGVIDADGFLVQNPRNDAWVPFVPPGYEAFLTDIGNQLKVVYAEHKFVNTLDHEIFAFLENPSTAVTQVPAITGFSPSSARPGDLVTINGGNFIDIQSVTFNGANAEIIAAFPDSLSVRVPDMAVSGAISVTNSAGTGSSPGSFTVIDIIPLIDSVEPPRGIPNSVVLVSGSGFDNLREVTIGGVPAQVIAATPSSIWISVPSGAASGALEVTNLWGTGSWNGSFEVLSPPAISEFSPNYGPAGTEVVVHGSNFDYMQSVEFGSTPVNFQVVSANEIRWTVPQGAAGYGAIKLHTDAGWAVSSSAFVVR